MKKTVLVQAGHLAPRDPNHADQTGTPGEIALVTEIRNKLVALLQADGRFVANSQPGYIRPPGIVVDAALFLHADGSGDPHASGYSLGYPNYAVNRALADLIAAEFNKLPGHPPHHRDNYTADMRGYYGFSRVHTAGPEVLVEHGFLTNPGEAAWLRAHTSELAKAEYHALLRYFGMPFLVPPKPAKAYKFSYATDEAAGDKSGKTNFPGLTLARIAKRLKKGDRVTIEKL